MTTQFENILRDNLLKSEDKFMFFKGFGKDLQSQFPNGQWKTINGAKVFINNGKVVAGLNNFNGLIDKFFEEKEAAQKKEQEAKEQEKKVEKPEIIKKLESGSWNGKFYGQNIYINNKQIPITKEDKKHIENWLNEKENKKKIDEKNKEEIFRDHGVGNKENGFDYPIKDKENKILGYLQKREIGFGQYNNNIVDKKTEISEKTSNKTDITLDEYISSFKKVDKNIYIYYDSHIGVTSESQEEALKKFRYGMSKNDPTREAYKALRQYNNKERIDYWSKELKDEMELLGKELSDYITKNPLQEDLTLYRTVQSIYAQKLASLDIGSVYSDISFASSSLQPLPYFGSFEIRILAKKGSMVSNIGNSSELEYIIQKDTKFKIIAKTDKGIIVSIL